ncbi:hypothetical protein BD779DRAFT_1558739 [Infundibulicybe gibba]|nr:hypothetical protein BD779DRAFT_1558739 [Infundibulicybe gibba]
MDSSQPRLRAAIWLQQDTDYHRLSLTGPHHILQGSPHMEFYYSPHHVSHPIHPHIHALYPIDDALKAFHNGLSSMFQHLSPLTPSSCTYIWSLSHVYSGMESPLSIWLIDSHLSIRSGSTDPSQSGPPNGHRQIDPGFGASHESGHSHTVRCAVLC